MLIKFCLKKEKKDLYALSNSIWHESSQNISDLFHDLKPTLKFKLSVSLGKKIDHLFSPKAQNLFIPYRPLKITHAVLKGES